MANEIWHNYDSASNLYAFVRRKSDDYIWDVGDSAFEALGTWNDARAGECDIAMTASGDYHSVDFPSGITNTAVQAYRVEIRVRAGGSPDTDDRSVAQGEIHWDGASEVDIGSINITQSSVTNIYEEEVSGPPIQVINL